MIHRLGAVPRGVQHDQSTEFVAFRLRRFVASSSPFSFSPSSSPSSRLVAVSAAIFAPSRTFRDPRRPRSATEVLNFQIARRTPPSAATPRPRRRANPQTTPARHTSPAPTRTPPRSPARVETLSVLHDVHARAVSNPRVSAPERARPPRADAHARRPSTSLARRSPVDAFGRRGRRR